MEFSIRTFVESESGRGPSRSLATETDSAFHADEYENTLMAQFSGLREASLGRGSQQRAWPFREAFQPCTTLAAMAA
jgi:hypothetical protein